MRPVTPPFTQNQTWVGTEGTLAGAGLTGLALASACSVLQGKD